MTTVVGTDELSTLREKRRAKLLWKNSSQAATWSNLSASALPITKRLLVRTLRQFSRNCGAGFACITLVWKRHSVARNSATKSFIKSFPVGGAVKVSVKESFSSEVHSELRR